LRNVRSESKRNGTKLERKKRKWITLAQVVEHVESVEGYPANSAMSQKIMRGMPVFQTTQYAQQMKLSALASLLL
jgi:hypothetical protein